ncbi:MAG TPA: four helix bundle protein [Planctomycetota bacterium]|nr:four helix bundle protein [Planctomycetota bacterium]
MGDFRKLDVWRRACTLARECFRLSAQLPRLYAHDLGSQIRRAAASIPANIAEGCGRWGRVEFARFLQIAYASACELESHFALLEGLALLPEGIPAGLLDELHEIQAMIVGPATPLARPLMTFVFRLAALDSKQKRPEARPRRWA